MKKGIFLLIAIALGALILHGCANHSSSNSSGFPKGHDLHSSSQQDQGQKGENPLKDYM